MKKNIPLVEVRKISTIKELLYYAIIKNKQPIYTQDINIKIDKYELNEYMKLELYWGQSYISSLIELANKNNMYATIPCAYKISVMSLCAPVLKCPCVADSLLNDK